MSAASGGSSPMSSVSAARQGPAARPGRARRASEQQLEARGVSRSLPGSSRSAASNQRAHAGGRAGRGTAGPAQKLDRLQIADGR